MKKTAAELKVVAKNQMLFNVNNLIASAVRLRNEGQMRQAAVLERHAQRLRKKYHLLPQPEDVRLIRGRERIRAIAVKKQSV